MRTFILNGVFLSLLFSNSFAQQSGMDFLTIGPNARALGLNETVTAEMLGASSLYTNPANLAFENNSSLDGAYTLWIGDLTHTHAAVNLKKGSGAFAVGFLGSLIDDIPLRGNQPGPADGSFNVSSLSFSAGYARKIGPIALGVTLQYLREEYYIYNASGFAVNFGAGMKIWNDKIHLGTSLLNWGRMDELRNESTTLPTTFRAGFNAKLYTFTPPENEDLPITVYLKSDVVSLLHSVKGTTLENKPETIYTNIAIELNIIDTISLRTGYKTGDTVRHWSAGAGISVSSFGFDYALIPFETGFGTVHSIGLHYSF